ncbi:Anaphase-promoting complex subunit [Lachnellula occidentalis]|uniref:Anaphase-promoting complex subunit 2 n=1 Tax=Lachnellula occidentalis TaxID=215460 RepID=A0A8H8S6S1_9HELO|nr:Anaphase-promoting complex subunit [Lachnellula occidentalis]
MTNPRSSTRQKRVFDSVFGAREISQPTPHATPDTGFTAPGQRFGGPLVDISHVFPAPSLANIRDDPRGLPQEESSYVKDKVRWDRSWHIVTHALLLPDFPQNWNSIVPLQPQKESLDGAFDHSLDNVLYPQDRLPFARGTEDIFEWHTQQVRSHFLHQVLPIILHLRENHAPDQLVRSSVRILETAHHQYVHGLAIMKEHMDISAPGTSMPILAKFRRDLHAIISKSVMEPLSAALRKLLERHIYTILGLPLTKGNEISAIVPEGSGSEEACRQVLGLVESLRTVGLAGEKFQVAFAEIMNNSMTEYVYRGCKGLWNSEDGTSYNNATGSSGKEGTVLPRAAHHSSPSRCVTDLCEWIENRYAKLAVQVLSVLDTKTQVSWGDKEKYKEMGIGRLAELRINELFDIVKNWPHSGGALDDLRTAITTPQRRLHLTEAFANTLNEKLLHPGASTLQILQTYISMIWSFHALDHSKVLLDRVAYPLQLYLCSREDTVRIIITGLLADPEDSQGKGSSVEKLVELAHLLNSGSEKIEQRAHDEDLDWHDMEWVPDPVDAGPGYKRSKNADIIGTLIGALGAQDVFIKEFQNIIGENLLKYDGGFEREIKVLELLKVRFGEAPLQACEVMLKDIQDSGRLNGLIRKNQKLNVTSDEEAAISSHRPEKQHRQTRRSAGTGLEEAVEKPSINAKILSRLFWPQLQDDNFFIPDEIATLQKRYEEGFASLKASRKLTWLHALGQATVELELEDRTIIEEVHTWQAMVIWAFENDENDETESQHTVEQLVEILEMEEPLVRSALKFWVNKLVLHEVSPSTFGVLETLNQEDRARSNAQAAASSSAANDNDGDEESKQLKKDGIESEKMQLYWQFIQSMLKNSSSQMPLQQIAMTLKMLIMDGFPYSNEELREFLARKVADGDLELAGGKYKLNKK